MRSESECEGRLGLERGGAHLKYIFELILRTSCVEVAKIGVQVGLRQGSFLSVVLAFAYQPLNSEQMLRAPPFLAQFSRPKPGVK
jgi:hypothetical protein